MVAAQALGWALMIHLLYLGLNTAFATSTHVLSHFITAYLTVLCLP